MRLIDANALKAKFDDIPPFIGLTGGCVQQCIDEAPTVDAVEVVHARWIRYKDEQENSVKYICSNCGDYHAFRNDGGSPFLTSERTFNENFVYCRKCGAKMDGERREGE